MLNLKISESVLVFLNMYIHFSKPRMFSVDIQGVHKVRVHFRVINFLKCTRTLWTPCMYSFLLKQSNKHK